MRVLAEIQLEANRALAKHGVHTPYNATMDPRDKLVVLVEELGEVGRCLTYDRDHAGDIRQELIQLAAMAALWAESLS